MDFLLEATQDGSCNQEESFDGKVTTPPSNQPATASAIPSSNLSSTSPKPPTTASPVQERELVEDETEVDQQTTDTYFEQGGFSSVKLKTTSSSIGSSVEDVREAGFIPVTQLQALNTEKSRNTKKPTNSDSRNRLEPGREVTFAPTTHSLREEKPEDNEVPVSESNEIDRSPNNEEADTKFGLKGSSVFKLEGNEMSLDEFEKDSAGGEKKEGWEAKNPVAEQGKFKVRQELLERSREGGADYKENEVGPEEEINLGKGYQIEKKVINRPTYIEVPRVIPHKKI